MCFHHVITNKEKCCGSMSPQTSFPQLFRIFPDFRMSNFQSLGNAGYSTTRGSRVLNAKVYEDDKMNEVNYSIKLVNCSQRRRCEGTIASRVYTLGSLKKTR